MTNKQINAMIVVLCLIIGVLITAIIAMTTNNNTKITDMLDRITATEAVADSSYIVAAEMGNAGLYLQFADGTSMFIENQDSTVTPPLADGRQ